MSRREGPSLKRLAAFHPLAFSATYGVQDLSMLAHLSSGVRRDEESRNSKGRDPGQYDTNSVFISDTLHIA
jgi:hypothetical protein